MTEQVKNSANKGSQERSDSNQRLPVDRRVLDRKTIEKLSCELNEQTKRLLTNFAARMLTEKSPEDIKYSTSESGRNCEAVAEFRQTVFLSLSSCANQSKRGSFHDLVSAVDQDKENWKFIDPSKPEDHVLPSGLLELDCLSNTYDNSEEVLNILCSDVAQEEIHYQEQVYFHPYIKNLFDSSAGWCGDKKNDKVEIITFQHRNLATIAFLVEVAQSREQETKAAPISPTILTAKVDRCLLHIVRPDVLILSMELVLTEDGSAYEVLETVGDTRFLPVKLNKALVFAFQDYCRRLFPPFFELATRQSKIEKKEFIANDIVKPQRHPLGMITLDVNGQILHEEQFSIGSQLRKFKETDGNPVNGLPLSLLPKKFSFEARAKPADRELISLKLLSDERMYTFSVLALNDPSTLNRTQHYRYCFCDEYSYKDQYPYAPTFTTDFEKRHCYDRFWGEEHFEATKAKFVDAKEGEDEAKKERDKYDYLGTRFYLTDYSFNVLTNSDSYFKYGVGNNCRTMYYKMVLLAIVQKACLLSLSNRLSGIASGGSDVVTSNLASTAFRDLLRFNGSLWFEEISSQMQPKELWLKLRQELGLESLKEQISKEAEDLTNYLETKSQVKAARSANLLAGIFGVVGVASVLPPTLVELSPYLLDIDQQSQVVGRAYFAGLVPLSLILLGGFIGWYLLKPDGKSLQRSLLPLFFWLTFVLVLPYLYFPPANQPTVSEIEISGSNAETRTNDIPNNTVDAKATGVEKVPISPIAKANNSTAESVSIWFEFSVLSLVSVMVGSFVLLLIWGRRK